MNRGLFTVLTALLLVAGMHAQQQVTVSGYAAPRSGGAR